MHKLVKTRLLFLSFLMFCINPVHAGTINQISGAHTAQKAKEVVEEVRRLDPNLFLKAETGPITPAKQEQLLAKIKKDYPQTETAHASNGLILTPNTRSKHLAVMYYITQPGHFAYPGVIQKIIYKNPASEIYILNRGWAGEDTSAFEQWMGLANLQDENLKARLSGR